MNRSVRSFAPRCLSQIKDMGEDRSEDDKILAYGVIDCM